MKKSNERPPFKEPKPKPSPRLREQPRVIGRPDHTYHCQAHRLEMYSSANTSYIKPPYEKLCTLALKLVDSTYAEEKSCKELMRDFINDVELIRSEL